MISQRNPSKTRSKSLKGNKNAKKDGPTADAVVSFRCLADDKANWTAKAKAEKLNLGRWVIKQLNKP